MMILRRKKNTRTPSDHMSAGIIAIFSPSLNSSGEEYKGVPVLFLVIMDER